MKRHEYQGWFVTEGVRRKGLQDGSETWCDVWFEDSNTDKNTGCWARGGRVEDALIFDGSDQNGQD